MFTYLLTEADGENVHRHLDSFIAPSRAACDRLPGTTDRQEHRLVIDSTGQQIDRNTGLF